MACISTIVDRAITCVVFANFSVQAVYEYYRQKQKRVMVCSAVRLGRDLIIDSGIHRVAGRV
jgi:hypothetical protein